MTSIRVVTEFAHAHFATQKKIKFVGVALPVLAGLGTTLRIAGVPESPTLVIVSVLLIGSFVLALVSARLDALQRAADALDQEEWRETDARWQEKWKTIRTEQMRELARRHYLEEREATDRRKPLSKAELAAMVERHKHEWEELMSA